MSKVRIRLALTDNLKLTWSISEGDNSDGGNVGLRIDGHQVDTLCALAKLQRVIDAAEVSGAAHRASQGAGEAPSDLVLKELRALAPDLTKMLGHELFKLAFVSDKLATKLRCGETDDERRLSVQFDFSRCKVAQLEDLPWEYLRDPESDHYLYEIPDASIVIKRLGKSARGDEKGPKQPQKSAPKIFLVSTVGLGPSRDCDAIVRKLEKFRSANPGRFTLEALGVAGGTHAAYSTVESELEGKRPDIVHLVGPECLVDGVPCIGFKSAVAKDGLEWVPCHKLLPVLAHSRRRLVIFDTYPHATSPLSAPPYLFQFARGLTQKKIAAFIGLQSAEPFEHTELFIDKLYTELLRGESLEQAFLASRRYMQLQSDKNGLVGRRPASASTVLYLWHESSAPIPLNPTPPAAPAGDDAAPVDSW